MGVSRLDSADPGLVRCLERLLAEARVGHLRGISLSGCTVDGTIVVFAGQYSGRRLVVVDDTTRIVAVDDPGSRDAKRSGCER